MFKYSLKHVLFVVVGSFLLSGTVNRSAGSGECFVTVHDRTIDGEPAWFNTGDTLYGTVRSNDYIYIRGEPCFWGNVITSRDEITLAEGANPHFEFEPELNAEPVELPRGTESIRRNAQPWVSTMNNQMMTWIRMMGENGIDIFQYPRGTPRAESLYVHINPPNWQTIFVDGDCEIKGELSGTLTIGCSGDMYLLDNIRYAGADPVTGQFDEEEMYSRLFLVAERNVIISNNLANGKDNGGDRPDGDHHRHSIVINAAVAALNGSFTFEHQNDDWDLYQGPEPDYRGFVFVKGMIYQRHKGHISRTNHGFTGYHLVCDYDSRLDEYNPLFYRESRYIGGIHDRLVLSEGSYYVYDADVNELIVNPGVELIFVSESELRVNNSLRMNGTADEPISVRSNWWQAVRMSFHVAGTNRSRVNISHVNFTDNIDIRFRADSIAISNCRFDMPVNLEGSLQVDSCAFNQRFSTASDGRVSINRSIFHDGITLEGDELHGSLVNNTIAGSRDCGVLIYECAGLALVNNIIAFNIDGIDNRSNRQITLTYNNVYDNLDGDYAWCEPGIGSISADPLFVDFRRGNLALQPESPCIDAGDPDAPRDRDGSRADMGAIPYIYPEKAPANKTLPEAYSLEIYPNPFNDRVKVMIGAGWHGDTQLKVIDVRGRVVYEQIAGKGLSGSDVLIDGGSLGSPGVYFVSVSDANKSEIRKVIYLP